MSVLSYITSFLSLIFHLDPDNSILNLSNYTYPSPKDSSYTYVAIMSTTDVHGYAFHRQFPSLSNFSYGGASLMYSYMKALRSEWGDRFLWFDSGDKYQGGLESTLSNGTIMTDFYNYAELDVSVLGNHEFDFGFDYLFNQMNKSDSPFLTTNLKNKHTNGTEAFNNTQNYIQSKVFKLGKGITIGMVGYTPEFNYYPKKVLEDIIFLNITNGIVKEAQRLRDEEKVSTVILLIHNGVVCRGDDTTIGVYNASHSVDDSSCDKENEIYKFIMNEMPDGLIDAVIGGHVHYPGHHFFKGIPVIHSQDKGVHFHILYLPFKDGKIVKESIQVEGPVPVCDMISAETKKCTINEKNSKMYPFYFHNYRIRSDKRLERKILQKYEAEFEKYRQYICYNEYEELTRSAVENALGNMQCDIIRNVSNADFSILNNGAFRATWYEGPLYLEDIYNMNPFKSIITTFEVNGDEFFKMLFALQGKKGFSQTSGVRQYFKLIDGKYELQRITMLNGDEIDKQKNYTFAMNDYLANGGDEFKKIFEWYTIRNRKEHGTVNDALEKTLKEMERIKKGTFYEEDKEKRRVVIIEDEPVEPAESTEN